MTKQLTIFRLFFSLFAASLLFTSAHLVRAQDVPGTLAYSGSTRSSNPTLPKFASSGSRSANALDVKKRSEFKLAIEEGNEARNNFHYGEALASYLKASQLFPKDEHTYYGLGNVYFDVYCYDGAIDFYSRAVKLKSDYFDALVQLGYAYFNKERYDEAEEQFTAAINLQPKNISARLARFYVWAKKGKYEEAFAGVNQIINDKPTSDADRAFAYIALANVFVAQKKWEESIAPLEKATKIKPDFAEAFVRLGLSQLVTAFSNEPPLMDVTLESKEKLTASSRQASETLRTAIDVKHYGHPNGYLLLGMALMYQSNYQGASSKITVYLEKVKQLQDRLASLDSSLTQKCDYAWGRLFADGHIQLGQIYEREADEPGANQNQLLDQAIQEYKKSVDSKQDYPSAHHALGTVYAKQHNYRDAVAEYERALINQTTDSDKAGTYGVIGTMYAQMGQYTDALDKLNTAIRLDPKVSTGYQGLAVVYRKQGDYDQAIRLQTKANELERQPRASSSYVLATAYFLRAQTKGNEADYEQAIELLNQAIKINPSFAPAYSALGNVYKFYKNGANVDAALANYEKAKSYNPNDASIYFLIGDLHASVTHNYDAAIKYLNEAIRLKPDYADAYWILALVHRERKDDTEAVRLFLEGLKYRKSRDAYFLLADTYDRQKNYAEAIKWMQEGVKVDPESHLPYLHLARFYTHWNKSDEAIRYYNEAINRLKPDDSANKNLYLCRIIRLRHQYDEALACFRKLVYPQTDQVPYEIGATYVDAGNKQAALAQYQQLVTLKSPLAESLLQQINEMNTPK